MNLIFWNRYSRLIILVLVLSNLYYYTQSTVVSAQTTREDLAYQLDINLEGSLQNPAISADGKMLLFTRFNKGYNRGPADLYVYNLETKDLKELVTDGTDNINLPGNSWNVDSTIVFSSSREPHDEIYTIDTDGNQKRITQRDDLVAYEPSWSSDGEWVVFESHPLDVEDEGVITKYRVDGTSEYIELSEATADSRQPNWSPVSDLIIYQKLMDGQWDIWIMNSDGTDNKRLTSGEGDKTDASFSSDGDWVIYSTDAYGYELANIFKIPLTGGDPIRLTSYSGYDGAPSGFISDNITYVAFESSDNDPDRSDGTTLWIKSTEVEPTNIVSETEGILIYPMNFILILIILPVLTYVYRKYN